VLDGGRTGNRQNHFGTLQQPGQSNLQGRCLKITGNFLDGLMRFLRLTERRPGKEGNAVLLTIIDDEIGRLVCGPAVLEEGSKRRHWCSRMPHSRLAWLIGTKEKGAVLRPRNRTTQCAAGL
jgi:hypothetical protein